MQKLRDIYVNDPQLRALAGRNRSNAYVLLHTNERHDNDPLPFLHLDHGDGGRRLKMYFLRVDDHDVIAASMTIYPYPAGYIQDIKHNEIHLSQICVRPEFRGRKLGASLMAKAFTLASRTGSVLSLSAFHPDGLRHLMPWAPVLHRAHPDLPVKYDGIDSPVTFRNPYKLAPGAWNNVALTYL